MVCNVDVINGHNYQKTKCTLALCILHMKKCPISSQSMTKYGSFALNKSTAKINVDYLK